jgi:glucose/arabinose dehydrogenase
MRHVISALAAFVAGVVSDVGVSTAVAVPPGFSDVTINADFDQAVGVTFSADGRGYVWEKAGRVWLLENGEKSATPLIDISQEVGNWRDLGLLGFALDPNFASNGYIYLLYTVDFHHLRFFGTPQYNPNANEYFRDTISRLTRYTARAEDGRRSVDPTTRLILVGETMSTGFPVCHQSHAIGTVLFGEDGSLIIGNGDGASYEEPDTGGPRNGSSNTARADGIIRASEDVGALRAQMVTSLSGKLIRIDPATGAGLPDNPFFDAGAPRSARSRVWALGFRNPYRFTLIPGSGGHGSPGALLVGDVGWYEHEEINLVHDGGENFGWPLFEGLTSNTDYTPLLTANRDAANPLGGTPGCTVPFLRFQDLIKQETLATPSFPNPCDANVQIPPTTPTLMHKRPQLEYGHFLPTRVPTFFGDAAGELDINDPRSPVLGGTLSGSSITLGSWYSGSAFPAEYRNCLYVGDFSGGWIKRFIFDESHQLTQVSDFHDSAGVVVCIAENPADGSLYYINYDEFGESRLHAVTFGGNSPPVAIATATPRFGPTPLVVQFSSAGSFDPEGDALRYEWDFGDGSPISTQPNPVHTYTAIEDISALGSFTARIFSLVPPGPMGGGNYDTNVMRDNDYPPVGNTDSQRQYDTFHQGDQGSFDFVGYVFSQPRELRSIVFQEGKHFFDGGWFDTFNVQVLIGGSWRALPMINVDPPYAGNNGINFETYRITFNPVVAQGIRIAGNPGGSNNFISIGEFRVIASTIGAGMPRKRDVRLTVRDNAGIRGTANLVVSTDNTPPSVQITSPVDGSLYEVNLPPQMIPLRANVSDSEHSGDGLRCAWRVILHHNTHSHPEPAIPSCEAEGLLTPFGCDGETYFYEFQLTVTDGGGLSTTRSVFMYPDCCPVDFDGNGQVDFFDYLDFTALFAVEDPAADFNGDGTIDFFDYLDFSAAFDRGCP